MDPTHLAGSLKVAILLQGMEPASRALILGHLDEAERALVNSHLAQMGPIAPGLIATVAAEFSSAIQGRSGKPGPKAKSAALEQGSPAEAKKPAAADEGASANLKALKSMDADHLIQLIKGEHPQTIAIILVHLSSQVASEVLARLPDDKKAEVSLRIANSDKVVSGMIEEIDRIFEEVLQNDQGATTHHTGGVARLAEILNQIDSTSAQLILDEIEENDPEMAAEIKQRMFVFEDLVLVDDKGMQGMLRRVETKDLAVALKAASEEVKNKVFRNMSERAAEMIKEEIDSAGAVRMKDVDAAQNAITKIIQEMESKGELVISGRGGEQFIG